MQDLFGFHRTDNEVTIANAAQINGLKIYFDFISKDEEKELLSNIERTEWLLDLKRRVQHFGYKYDYKRRRIDSSLYIGELPIWLTHLCNRLREQQLITFMPDQAIVNEYIDDQGIAPHIDCEPCFGDTIISISLSGPCVMNFQKELSAKDDQKIPLFIPPRTLVVMTGESRFNWHHGIPPRRTDKFNQQIHKRQRRVSVTFRKVVLD